MWLHVRVVGPEELLRPVDRELLGLVDPLAAAVVALARQSLGVLVGENGAGGFEDALGTKFSEAISSSVFCWRSSSPWMMSAISGSTAASGSLK